jgi:hypothetical protein
MKFWLPTLVACSFLAGCASNSDHSVPASDAPAKSSAEPQVAGIYVGKWTASDGGTGTLRVTLKKAADAPWQGKVTFTYEGDEATTTMKTVEVSGAHVLLSYDYDIQGNQGGVEMAGDLAGDSLQGSYKITSGDGNPGNWTASRAP